MAQRLHKCNECHACLAVDIHDKVCKRLACAPRRDLPYASAHATLARATGQPWHDQSRGRQRSSANSNGAALMHLKSCSMASDEALLAAEAAAIGGSDAQPSPSRVRLMLTSMGSAKPRALAPKPPS